MIITKKLLNRTMYFFDNARGSSAKNSSQDKRNINMHKFEYNLKNYFDIPFHTFHHFVLNQQYYFTKELFERTLSYLKENSIIIWI